MAKPQRELRKPPDPLGQVRDHLKRLIRLRPRSVKEARLRLRRAGFPSDVIESVIEEAADRGWLDDEAFAKLWVRDRLLTKPRSRALLKKELLSKGVSREIIERLLAEAELNEEKLIRDLIERRGDRYQGLDPETRKRRLYAFLRRRGFSAQAIRRALRPSE